MFLKEVAKDLLNKYGVDMTDVAVVFPNKRAALFLNNELAQLANKPMWSPSYMTISDFFRQQSSLTVADPIKSVCDLYQSYIEETGNLTETLDQFYGWGQLLLSDYDDLDKNMADASMLFSNISNLRELDDVSYLTDEQKAELHRFFANFEDNPEGIRERFIALWSNLNNIYINFKQRLKNQGLAYEGMMYRDVIEKNNIKTQYKHYAFVGFNVLQKVEQVLFDRLKDKAAFYWDYDYYYMKKGNEAGNYIRKWLDQFPNALQNDNEILYDNLKREKDINFISASTEDLQARYITKWLREDNRYEDGKRTAIVMCDEHLLHTVIHCIPENMRKLNVTTGYPLQQTPIASFVTQLIALQTEGYSAQEKAFRLHYVNRVLRHPYCKYIVTQSTELLNTLNKEKRFYITADVNSLFTHYSVDKQHLPELITWIIKIVRSIGVNGATNKDPLFVESTFRMYTLLTRVLELMKSEDLDTDIIIFRRLLSELISSTSIPFHGEPASGVQVMGILETRNLDFDHVLVLSCNEGNMPKGVDDASFIPPLIRKAYGLTTIDNKVSIYSYYFHELIQRAQDITFLYNSSTQGSKTGEMSRFMLQLMTEWNHPIHRLKLQAGQNTMQIEAEIIQKEQGVLKKIDEIKRFSPTAINTYMRCQLMFYFKYIAGIAELNDIDEDDIDGRLFGNIFHRSAQLMYEKLLPLEIITAKDIDNLLKTGKSTQPITSGNTGWTLEGVIDDAFATELFNLSSGTKKHPKLNGLQLINKEVVNKYLRQLLKIDRRLTPLRVISHEFDVRRNITIKSKGIEKTVEVGGRIDRLDEVFSDNKTTYLRVVDYKTGSKKAEELKSIQDVFDSKNIRTKKSDYTMQALLYSLIEAKYDNIHNPYHKPVSPALLFIQHAGGNDYTPVISMAGEKITDVTVYEEDFMKELSTKLAEIYDPETPFSPTADLKICEYCPYKQLCGR